MLIPPHSLCKLSGASSIAVTAVKIILASPGKELGRGESCEGREELGPSLHSPPTGSHARVSESQRTPTEAKHPGLARPGKTQGGSPHSRGGQGSRPARWGWARRALTSRACAGTAINAREQERAAEALGAGLCTAAAQSSDARSPPASATGLCACPRPSPFAPRPGRLHSETLGSPPWPAN